MASNRYFNFLMKKLIRLYYLFYLKCWTSTCASSSFIFTQKCNYPPQLLSNVIQCMFNSQLAIWLKHTSKYLKGHKWQNMFIFYVVDVLCIWERPVVVENIMCSDSKECYWFAFFLPPGLSLSKHFAWMYQCSSTRCQAWLRLYFQNNPQAGSE